MYLTASGLRYGGFNSFNMFQCRRRATEQPQAVERLQHAASLRAKVGTQEQHRRRTGLRARREGTAHDLGFFHTHLVYVRPLRGPSAHSQSPGNRLQHAAGKEGCSEESAKTSLRSGNKQKRYVSINVSGAGLDKGRERRLEAKVHAAAKARSANQRNTNAAVHAARCAERAARALLRARSLTQRFGDSSAHHAQGQAQQPDSGTRKQTLGKSAFAQSCPSGAPHQCGVKGNLHTAHKGRPFASFRDDFYASLVLADRTKWRSRTRICIATRAPASRHTLAAAPSSEPPRERKKPDRGQAAE